MTFIFFKAEHCNIEFNFTFSIEVALQYYKSCYDTIHRCYKSGSEMVQSGGVTLAQLVKASVGQAVVQRFEPHLGHNLLSCGVFLPLAQTIRPNWQSRLAGGSVAIQKWSIYKVYT